MTPFGKDQLQQLGKENGVKPRLMSELRFAPEQINDWDERDFLAVANKSANEGILVVGDDYRVVPFLLRPRTANVQGRKEAIICDICATWQRGSHSAIMTLQKQGRRVSFLVCSDLLCSLHVRDRTPASTLSRTQLHETISTVRRIERLRRRLSEIIE